jgi:hypothetical protein
MCATLIEPMKKYDPSMSLRGLMTFALSHKGEKSTALLFASYAI